MTTWFTSDLHLGHRLVAGLRGFENVEDHNFSIMEKWWDQVKPDDIVWVLGDIAVSQHQQALNILAELPGRKRLISGNHDPVHPTHRTALAKWHAKFFEVFEVVQPFGRIRVDGHEVLLSHFPFMSVGDGAGRGEARFEQFRLPELGLPLLHGHTHSGFVHEGPLQFHVGWDAWNGLVPDWEVKEWLNNG